MNATVLLKITISVILLSGCALEASSKEKPSESGSRTTSEKCFLPPSFHEVLTRASSGKTYYDEALFCFVIGAYDKAIEKIDKAIELDRDNADFFFLRGAIQFASGRYQAAVTDLSSAIEIDPTMVPAYRLRGKTKERIGDRNGAAKDFERAKLLEVEQSKNSKKE